MIEIFVKRILEFVITSSNANKLFLISNNSKGTVSKVWIPFDYVEKHSPVNNEVWRRMRLNG